MSFNPESPLDRIEDETIKAHTAFMDYWSMGAGRSMRALQQTYSESTTQKPPTTVLRTLATWSDRYQWQARIAARKALDDAEIKDIERQRRIEAMESGLAADYERVLRLKHLADSLGREIWRQDGEFVKDAIWLPDVKQIGSGDFAERVDIVRFNRPILEEFRAILDDLAKETGGRRQKSDMDITTGGKPIDESLARALKAVYGDDDDNA